VATADRNTRPRTALVFVSQGRGKGVQSDQQERRTASLGSIAMSDSSPIPTQLGRYRILEELGRGGMGAVYLAEDTQLERPVALKVPRFPDENRTEVIQRFYREAQLAQSIHHPYVCQVYEVG